MPQEITLPNKYLVGYTESISLTKLTKLLGRISYFLVTSAKGYLDHPGLAYLSSIFPTSLTLLTRGLGAGATPYNIAQSLDANPAA